MTRGIEDVDLILNILTIRCIVEFHHRRGDRDTTLFLDVHPVRCGCLLNLVVLDGTSYLNLTTEQEEFLSQGRLTGISLKV